MLHISLAKRKPAPHFYKPSGIPALVEWCAALASACLELPLLSDSPKILSLLQESVA